MTVVFAGLSVTLLGCLTTEERNPYVDIESYDTVVIEDFSGHESGYEFSERFAKELSQFGPFERVLRMKPDARAIRIRGEITTHEKGNPALRARYGRNIGNARFGAMAYLEDYETGEFIASLKVYESYSREPSHRQRIHQSIETLIARAARQLAEEVSNPDL